MVKIYKQPFAHGGDAIAIPDASQPDGKMSSTDGWTPDYQLPKTDPNYKPVGRQEMNGVFKEVTDSLGEIQQFGFAKWQPITWPQGARVVENDVVYRALTQTSQQPPHADWVEDVPDINSILHPSMTGSITLDGTTGNRIIMAGIVTKLSLEAGDVIRINTGTYNKLHTVENFETNNQIRVNWEHAGNRGNGSLRLPDFTGQATVTRIAKWFNAPIGLGQAWQNMSSSRTLGTTYTNTTGRPISVAVSNVSDSGVQEVKRTSIIIVIDGAEIMQSYSANIVSTTSRSSVTAIVTNGSTYKCELVSGSTQYNIVWRELR